MKKQLPLFKWTSTEWDVLQVLHKTSGIPNNRLEVAHEIINDYHGHRMTLKSMQVEIHEIRKKMYEYSKHMTPSLDAVLKAQGYFYTEMHSTQVQGLRDELRDWKSLQEETHKEYMDLKNQYEKVTQERDHLSMTITEDRALWKEQEDWKKKYEWAIGRLKHTRSLISEYMKQESGYEAKIEALKDQCKKADEVIQEKRDLVNSYSNILNRCVTERDKAYKSVGKAFIGGILLTLSIVFAYYMIFIRV